jgi:hypothetical protein
MSNSENSQFPGFLRVHLKLMPTHQYTNDVDSRKGDSQMARRIAVAIAFSLMMLTLWAVTHRYRGFARDGELYAFQAMARLHPSLGADLYLQNTSQDQYTIFSPIYATFIKMLGLQTAEMVLFSICTVWFLTAAWMLARRLSTADGAWLSVTLLIVTEGYYGAYQIFSYSENYLTARLLGEALTATALASHFHGWRRLALMIGALALFVHPLMAIPGVVLLICLWLPVRLASIFAVAGVLTILAFALIASTMPASSGLAVVMDPAWLEVVRERSQFLFLKYWTTTDCEIAARPFVCLTLTALVMPDLRIRKLCLSAMLVGASGMAVAAIAGAIGPIAILLQGQAWRWVWVTAFASVVLLAPTAVSIWRDDRCGPLCAMLLILGWTCSGVDALACVDAALILWLLRSRFSVAAAGHLRWAAGAIGILTAGWILSNRWAFAWAPTALSGPDSPVTGRLRDIFGLGISGAILAWLSWYGIRMLRSGWAIYLVGVTFLAAAAWIVPKSFQQPETVGTAAELRDFADWREAIPPASNVLLIPTGKSASFMWFTLVRPSYLSVAQSAGVVFSRATSLEVRRRSEVLMPLGDPDWKILTSITAQKSQRLKGASTAASAAASQPLTRDILIQLCDDPKLNFVIAQENVGFDPLRHAGPGRFNDWNLYDCRRVRSATPVA